MKARLPARLSKSQREAMNREINRQILENDEKFAMDADASVLWTLHTVFGFGKKRLRKFYEENLKMHNEMREYYEFNTDDTFWLCRNKLKEYGIDIEKWYKEDNP